MATNTFKFKHFELAYQQSSMPVGTDAVLLGAWATHPCPTRVLDIGCGCGVISLMLAQRYSSTIVDAIDIDTPSVKEAGHNFSTSPFSKRLNTIQADIRSWETEEKYSLIVSNPPYYTNGPMSENDARKLARHTLTLSHADLQNSVAKLLDEDGVFCCVLPYTAIKAFVKIAEHNNLFLNRLSYIKSNPKNEVSVALLALSKKDIPIEITELILMNKEGKPTEEYAKLVKDFYIWA